MQIEVITALSPTLSVSLPIRKIFPLWSDTQKFCFDTFSTVLHAEFFIFILFPSPKIYSPIDCESERKDRGKFQFVSQSLNLCRTRCTTCPGISISFSSQSQIITTLLDKIKFNRHGNRLTRGTRTQFTYHWLFEQQKTHVADLPNFKKY